jgi:hypothetical protein
MRKIMGTMGALLAAGALAGFVPAGIVDGSQTYQVTVDPGQLRGATAELQVEDGDATLVAEGLPEPVGAYGRESSHEYGDGFFVENEDAQVAGIDFGEQQEFFVAAGPHLWGLHNYQDTNRHTSTDTRLIVASANGASNSHEYQLAA